MPVKFIQKQAQKTKQKQHEEIEIAEKVEEMAELLPQIDALKKYKERYEKLRCELLEKIPDGMEAEGIEFFGTKHMVEFTPCADKRAVADMVKLRNALGEATFMAIAKVLLEDVDKYLSEIEQESIIVKSQTGARKCKVKELGPPA